MLSDISITSRLDFAKPKTKVFEKLVEAKRLESWNFSTNFDPLKTGLLDVVRHGMLSGEDAAKEVRAELKNLIVYGKSSGCVRFRAICH